MDAALLTKILGREQQWHGPCTVILDSDASIQTAGGDAIAAAGAKVYAPRTSSARVQADQVCLMQDGTALVVVQQQKTRQASGEETVRNVLTVADVHHVVALEFPDTAILAALGVPPPQMKASAQSGVHKRP